jgi:CNT family concentrative nucleoside transporter
MIFITYGFSRDRKKVSIKVSFICLLLQVVVALFFLKTSWGVVVFSGIKSFTSALSKFSLAGTSFLFGNLVLDESFGFIFAFKTLPIIVYMGTLLSFLYYIGFMKKIIYFIGKIFQKIFQISLPEALGSSANILLAQTESPLVIKHFIKTLDSSQLLLLMTVGMSTTAGTVLLAYTSYGVEAGHLISATFMSIPCAVFYSKILFPSQKQGNDQQEEVEDEKKSLVETLSETAINCMKIALNIGAILLAFISLIATVNGLFIALGLPPLDRILGWIMAPIAYLIGISWNDSILAGMIIGKKIILNEFIAFASLKEVEHLISLETKTILTYVLCSFSNISSMALQLGVWGSLAANQKPKISRLVSQALLLSIATSFTLGIIIGILYKL